MRILHEKDKEALLSYVGKEPEMNLFFIGDIENFGIESETVTVYLHEERDRWDFVILRYYQYFLLYSRYDDYNAAEAIAFLRGQEPDCISGKTVLLERIAPAFPQREIQSTYMSRCDHMTAMSDLCGCGAVKSDSGNCQDNGTESGGQTQKLVIRRLEKADAAEAVRLLSDIEEFQKTFKKDELEEQIQHMESEMEQGSKAAMGGFLDGRMVCTASTSAENSQSAMVVGVATVRAFRGRGYASAVVAALCQDCFARGKKYLCLFYDNPTAGKIYNRIGFQELGEYGMLR